MKTEFAHFGEVLAKTKKKRPHQASPKSRCCSGSTQNAPKNARHEKAGLWAAGSRRSLRTTRNNSTTPMNEMSLTSCSTSCTGEQHGWARLHAMCRRERTFRRAGNAIGSHHEQRHDHHRLTDRLEQLP